MFIAKERSISRCLLHAPSSLRRHDCRVIDLSHDQDSTDLMKCLQCAQHKLGQRDASKHDGVVVLVLGRCHATAVCTA